MTKPFYILDSDTGADDCAAIFLCGAFAKDRARLLLSSYGNYTLQTTTANFCSSAALCGFSMPVTEGPLAPQAASPRVVPSGTVFSQYSPDFPIGDPPVRDTDYLQAVYRTLCENSPCDYIALGPLTALAALLRRYPDAKQKINRIMIMGGGLWLANITPYAEYNIYCDAEAAEEVFASGVPIWLAPLDVCMQTALTDEQAEGLLQFGDNRIARCFRHIMQIEKELSEGFGNPPGILYDAVAIACYLHPEYGCSRETGIRVITQGERYGQTVEDESRSNVTVFEQIDQTAYYKLLSEGLRILAQPTK